MQLMPPSIAAMRRCDADVPTIRLIRRVWGIVRKLPDENEYSNIAFASMSTQRRLFLCACQSGLSPSVHWIVLKGFALIDSIFLDAVFSAATKQECKLAVAFLTYRYLIPRSRRVLGNEVVSSPCLPQEACP